MANSRAPTASPPSRILVEVHTSSPMLDKWSDEPFTITLSVRVDHDQAITINTSMTLLDAQSEALDHQGLTFQNSRTGAFAERRQLDVEREPPSENLTATSAGIVELPPRDAVDTAYTVSHTFERLPPWTPDLSASAAGLSELQKQLAAGASQVRDQTAGLEAGHSYEIGLGREMSAVGEWREGRKVEVFLRGAVARRAFVGGPPLRMELVNVATFGVVDGRAGEGVAGRGRD